ncbi:hypothetical protein FNF28_01368 [Cafeteria roenbergensis]|uniref:Uncharacterized protein n=1 Tax=Cafeteria roenbergensis TaxID=33653 RepID=A0A5A8DYR0_CAFRO|nr:hypothetical protein FNF28_01368 [Cafeteria roenbergensis]
MSAADGKTAVEKLAGRLQANLAGLEERDDAIAALAGILRCQSSGWMPQAFDDVVKAFGARFESIGHARCCATAAGKPALMLLEAFVETQVVAGAARSIGAALSLDGAQGRSVGCVMGLLGWVLVQAVDPECWRGSLTSARIEGLHRSGPGTVESRGLRPTTLVRFASRRSSTMSLTFALDDTATWVPPTGIRFAKNHIVDFTTVRELLDVVTGPAILVSPPKRPEPTPAEQCLRAYAAWLVGRHIALDVRGAGIVPGQLLVASSSSPVAELPAATRAAMRRATADMVAFTKEGAAVAAGGATVLSNLPAGAEGFDRDPAGDLRRLVRARHDDQGEGDSDAGEGDGHGSDHMLRDMFDDGDDDDDDSDDDDDDDDDDDSDSDNDNGDEDIDDSDDDDDDDGSTDEGVRIGGRGARRALPAGNPVQGTGFGSPLAAMAADLSSFRNHLHGMFRQLAGVPLPDSAATQASSPRLRSLPFGMLSAPVRTQPSTDAIEDPEPSLSNEPAVASAGDARPEAFGWALGEVVSFDEASGCHILKLSEADDDPSMEGRLPLALGADPTIRQATRSRFVAFNAAHAKFTVLAGRPVWDAAQQAIVAERVAGQRAAEQRPASPPSFSAPSSSSGAQPGRTAAPAGSEAIDLTDSTELPSGAQPSSGTAAALETAPTVIDIDDGAEAGAPAAGAAAAAGPAEPEEPEGMWACPRCTVHNRLEVAVCTVCGADAPPSAERRRQSAGVQLAGTQAVAAGEDEWSCSGCTFLNPLTQVACGMCGSGMQAADMERRQARFGAAPAEVPQHVGVMHRLLALRAESSMHQRLARASRSKAVWVEAFNEAWKQLRPLESVLATMERAERSHTGRIPSARLHDAAAEAVAEGGDAGPGLSDVSFTRPADVARNVSAVLSPSVRSSEGRIPLLPMAELSGLLECGAQTERDARPVRGEDLSPARLAVWALTELRVGARVDVRTETSPWAEGRVVKLVSRALAGQHALWGSGMPRVLFDAVEVRVFGSSTTVTLPLPIAPILAVLEAGSVSACESGTGLAWAAPDPHHVLGAAVGGAPSANKSLALAVLRASLRSTLDKGAEHWDAFVAPLRAFTSDSRMALLDTVKGGVAACLGHVERPRPAGSERVPFFVRGHREVATLGRFSQRMSEASRCGALARSAGITPGGRADRLPAWRSPTGRGTAPHAHVSPVHGLAPSLLQQARASAPEASAGQAAAGRPVRVRSIGVRLVFKAGSRRREFVPPKSQSTQRALVSKPIKGVEGRVGPYTFGSGVLRRAVAALLDLCHRLPAGEDVTRRIARAGQHLGGVDTLMLFAACSLKAHRASTAGRGGGAGENGEEEDDDMDAQFPIAPLIVWESGHTTDPGRCSTTGIWRRPAESWHSVVSRLPGVDAETLRLAASASVEAAAGGAASATQSPASSSSSSTSSSSASSRSSSSSNSSSGSSSSSNSSSGSSSSSNSSSGSSSSSSSSRSSSASSSRSSSSASSPAMAAVPSADHVLTPAHFRAAAAAAAGASDTAATAGASDEAATTQRPEDDIPSIDIGRARDPQVEWLPGRLASTRYARDGWPEDCRLWRGRLSTSRPVPIRLARLLAEGRVAGVEGSDPLLALHVEQPAGVAATAPQGPPPRRVRARLAVRFAAQVQGSPSHLVTRWHVMGPRFDAEEGCASHDVGAALLDNQVRAAAARVLSTWRDLDAHPLVTTAAGEPVRARDGCAINWMMGNLERIVRCGVSIERTHSFDLQLMLVHGVDDSPEAVAGRRVSQREPTLSSPVDQRGQLPDADAAGADGSRGEGAAAKTREAPGAEVPPGPSKFLLGLHFSDDIALPALSPHKALEAARRQAVGEIPAGAERASLVGPQPFVRCLPSAPLVGVLGTSSCVALDAWHRCATAAASEGAPGLLPLGGSVAGSQDALVDRAADQGSDLKRGLSALASAGSAARAFAEAVASLESARRDESAGLWAQRPAAWARPGHPPLIHRAVRHTVLEPDSSPAGTGELHETQPAAEVAARFAADTLPGIDSLAGAVVRAQGVGSMLHGLFDPDALAASQREGAMPDVTAVLCGALGSSLASTTSAGASGRLPRYLVELAMRSPRSLPWGARWLMVVAAGLGPLRWRQRLEDGYRQVMAGPAGAHLPRTAFHDPASAMRAVLHQRVAAFATATDGRPMTLSQLARGELEMVADSARGLGARRDRVLVRRSMLLDDASRLLRVHTSLPAFRRAHLEARFEGEMGHGSGVTREFFALLAEAVASIKVPDVAAAAAPRVTAPASRSAPGTTSSSSSSSSSSSPPTSGAPLRDMAAAKRPRPDPALQTAAARQLLASAGLPSSLARAVGGPADWDKAEEGASGKRMASFGGAGAGDLFFSVKADERPSRQGAAAAEHPAGLFPLPLATTASQWERTRHASVFETVGRAAGVALMDGHVLPLRLCPLVFEAVQEDARREAAVASEAGRSPPSGEGASAAASATAGPSSSAPVAAGAAATRLGAAMTPDEDGTTRSAAVPSPARRAAKRTREGRAWDSVAAGPAADPAAAAGAAADEDGADWELEAPAASGWAGGLCQAGPAELRVGGEAERAIAAGEADAEVLSKLAPPWRGSLGDRAWRHFVPSLHAIEEAAAARWRLRLLAVAGHLTAEEERAAVSEQVTVSGAALEDLALDFTDPACGHELTNEELLVAPPVPPEWPVALRAARRQRAALEHAADDRLSAGSMGPAAAASAVPPRATEELRRCLDPAATWERLFARLRASAAGALELSSENVDAWMAASLKHIGDVGIRPAARALRKGLQAIVPGWTLLVMTPTEAVRLFCGEGEVKWTMAELRKHVQFGSGLQPGSQQAQWLLEELVGMSQQERKEFLRFVTGCPALPAGGLAALHMPIRVHRRVASSGREEHALPSTSTCFHQLKLPAYKSRAVLGRQLRLGMAGSAGAIDFS